MSHRIKQQEMYETLTDELKERQFESPLEMCRELLQKCDSNYVIDMLLRDKFGLGVSELESIRKRAAKS
jgi:hypothetical protein